MAHTAGATVGAGLGLGSRLHVQLHFQPPHLRCLRTQQRGSAARAQASADGENQGFKRIFNQVRGALPVIGLISRLASPEGGIGRDELAYPEYARTVFEAAPQDFQVAVAELQDKHGKPSQRRYVLMCLWMVERGIGLVPAKQIVDAARRLRVSQDLEFEMERFTGSFTEAAEKYSYMDRPKGRPTEQAETAVDALVRLCLGLKDGEPVPAADAALIEEAVCGGLLGTGPNFRELVKAALASREQRAKAYAS